MSLTIDALHGEQEARAIVEEDLSNANNIISNLNRQIEKLEGDWREPNLLIIKCVGTPPGDLETGALYF